MCPIACTIDHEERLVRATASGDVFLDDIRNYFDTVSVQDAAAYGKLFDAREMVPHLSDDDFMVLAACVSAYAAFAPRGAIAAVATSQAALFALQRYANFAGGDDRPIRLFASIDEAEAWLRSFQAADRDGSRSSPGPAAGTSTARSQLGVSANGVALTPPAGLPQESGNAAWAAAGENVPLIGAPRAKW